MTIIPQPVSFSWDEGNIDTNLKKHNVTTQEAEEAFLDESFAIRRDARHGSGHEMRYQALGKTKRGRRLFVAFTVRGKLVRVISIRDMTRDEEKAYEKRVERNS